MLTTQLHPQLKPRMSGAIPVLAYMPSWHGQGQIHSFFYQFQHHHDPNHNHLTFAHPLLWKLSLQNQVFCKCNPHLSTVTKVIIWSRMQPLPILIYIHLHQHLPISKTSKQTMFTDKQSSPWMFLLHNVTHKSFHHSVEQMGWYGGNDLDLYPRRCLL
jgi:hypothetical protein